MRRIVLQTRRDLLEGEGATNRATRSNSGLRRRLASSQNDNPLELGPEHSSASEILFDLARACSAHPTQTPDSRLYCTRRISCVPLSRWTFSLLDVTTDA